MSNPALSLIGTASIPSLVALDALARKLALLLRRGDMVTLKGEMGAGKTALVRCMLQVIMEEPAEVTSPTFNLMQSYEVILADGHKETVWHLDLFRLEEPQEAEPLGLRELEQHIMLVEWPEIIDPQLPASRLEVHFAFEGADTRILYFHGNETWRGRLAAIW